MLLRNHSNDLTRSNTVYRFNDKIQLNNYVTPNANKQKHNFSEKNLNKFVPQKKSYLNNYLDTIKEKSKTYSRQNPRLADIYTFEKEEKNLRSISRKMYEKYKNGLSDTTDLSPSKSKKFFETNKNVLSKPVEMVRSVSKKRFDKCNNDLSSTNELLYSTSKKKFKINRNENSDPNVILRTSCKMKFGIDKNRVTEHLESYSPSKRSYPLKNKNIQSKKTDENYKPIIKIKVISDLIKSLERVPSSEYIMYNDKRVQLPAAFYEKYGMYYSKEKSASKLYDCKIFDSNDEEEEIKFKPTKRVISPIKNMDDIINYKDALIYREEKLTGKITTTPYIKTINLLISLNKQSEKFKNRNEKYLINEKELVK